MRICGFRNTIRHVVSGLVQFLQYASLLAIFLLNLITLLLRWIQRRHLVTQYSKRMVTLLFSEFERLTADKFDVYLNKLPENIRLKVLKFRNWNDQHASLFGKLLLNEAFERLAGGRYALTDLKYNNFNRPFIDSTFDFNISHSANIVGCVMGENISIGIDIEKKESINFDDFANIFTRSEWRSIRTSPDMTDTFYDLWTQKEAVIKASGEGLSIPFDKIIIEDGVGWIGTRRWFICRVWLHEAFKTCLASSKPIEELKVLKLNF